MENTYTVVVDYSKPLEKMVEEVVRLGRYCWYNGYIVSQNFPTRRTGKAEVRINLIHFDRRISTDDVLKELDRMGYRPAEVHELLAFGEKYPNMQLEFPIVALASVWYDPINRRKIPCLTREGPTKRRLILHWDDNDAWREDYRFAAVPL